MPKNILKKPQFTVIKYRMDELLKQLYSLKSFSSSSSNSSNASNSSNSSNSTKPTKPTFQGKAPHSDLEIHKVFKTLAPNMIDTNIYKTPILDLTLRTPEKRFTQLQAAPHATLLTKLKNKTGTLYYSIVTNKLYHSPLPKTKKITPQTLQQFENWRITYLNLIHSIESHQQIRDYLFGNKKGQLRYIQYQYLRNWLTENEIPLKPDYISLIHQVYKNREVTDEKGNKYPFKSAISKEYGTMIYDLIIKQNLTKTMEVGLAFGGSSLFICAAHLNANNPKSFHIAIDPNQSTQWHNVAVTNIKRLGYPRMELIEQPSYRALPQILNRLVGNTKWINPTYDPNYPRLDLCFVDGWHTFDATLVDMYYCDLLLRPGGYLIVDDAKFDALKDLAKYIDSNWQHYERVNTTYKLFLMYRKKNDDQRSWDFHVKFVHGK